MNNSPLNILLILLLSYISNIVIVFSRCEHERVKKICRLERVNPYGSCYLWLILPIHDDAKNLKMIETLAYGYSFESTR